MIGVVPQEIKLFSADIIDNIALGDYEPDMQRVMDLCEQLGITDFVARMPEGFKTYLGENGVGISGGQRQRLAIARALYKQPEIIILDEATSSLDTISEHFVQKTIQALRNQGKTIIIIAHRLSTIRNADKIMVMKDGQLIEEGTHQELIGKEQSYHRLWTQQITM